MTDSEINKAMAEELGWTEVRPSGNMMPGQWDGIQPGTLVLLGILKTEMWQKVPDFCSDLNAMAVAEASAGVGAWTMVHHLTDIVNVDCQDGWDHSDVWRVATATARQRAEAFLKTVGKWKKDVK
jgi:hypothetical protein